MEAPQALPAETCFREEEDLLWLFHDLVFMQILFRNYSFPAFTVYSLANSLGFNQFSIKPRIIRVQ